MSTQCLKNVFDQRSFNTPIKRWNSAGQPLPTVNARKIFSITSRAGHGTDWKTESRYLVTVFFSGLSETGANTTDWATTSQKSAWCAGRGSTRREQNDYTANHPVNGDGNP